MSDPAASPPPGREPGPPAGQPPPGRRPAGDPRPFYPAAVHPPHAHRATPVPGGVRRDRPLVVRLGMVAVAAVTAVLFAAVGAVSIAGGNPLLGLMALLGALLTAWVGLLTARDR